MPKQRPDFLTLYRQFSDRSEPPQIYKDWAGVCAIASALGRNTWIDWYEPLYSNQWVVLVGPGGCRKGTAMAPVKLLLEANSIPIASDSITREALFKDLCSPDFQRLPVKQHPADKSAIFSVISIFGEEFTSFTGTHDNTQFLTDLCRLYECPRHWEYKTKNSGTSPMEGVCINLFAGTTPKNIISALPPEAIGSGFSSRIMFVYADKKSQIVMNPAWTTTEYALFKKLTEQLKEITKISGEFKPTDAWWARYEQVYLEQEATPPLTDPRFESYLCRRQAHLVKVSMAMSASRGHDLELNEEDFERAFDLLSRTEERMERVFQGFGRNPSGDIRYTVAERVRTLREIPFFDLYNLFADDASMDSFKDTIAVLSGTKFLRLEPRNGTLWIIHTPDEFEELRKKRMALFTGEPVKEAVEVPNEQG